MKTLIALIAALIFTLPCYGSMESGGGGTAYDQELNTTDDVEFGSVTINGTNLNSKTNLETIIGEGLAEDSVVMDTLGSDLDTQAELRQAAAFIKQDITPADEEAITPTAGYSEVRIYATAAVDDCDITFAETGAVDGNTYLFVNEGSNTIRVAYSGGNFETKGGAGSTMLLEQNDSFEMQYQADRYVVTANNTSTVWLSSIDMGGGTLEVPNTSSGDQTLTIGQVGLKADEDLLVSHGGAAGEVQDEAGISLINKLIVRFDPEFEYDTVTENLIDLLLLGDAEPHGITITQWNIDYINGDPTTEIDLDLICDSGGDWNDDAGTTVMDVLDTTAGTASADTGFDSSTCGNGSSVYLRFGADPVDSDEIVRFTLQYYLNED